MDCNHDNLPDNFKFCPKCGKLLEEIVFTKTYLPVDASILTIFFENPVKQFPIIKVKAEFDVPKELPERYSNGTKHVLKSVHKNLSGVVETNIYPGNATGGMQVTYDTRWFERPKKFIAWLPQNSKNEITLCAYDK